MYLKLVIVTLTVLNLNRVLGQFGQHSSQYDNLAATTKTYDLQVPGSNPIRIIEAEPLWDRDPQDLIVPTTERSWTDLEHRALRPMIKATTLQTKTTVNSPGAQSEENETEDATQDSAEELRKFLKGYAEQLRYTTKSPGENNDYYDSSERFHKVELITKPSEEPTNRLANLYLHEKHSSKDIPDSLAVEDKSKSWNLLNLKRHKHPSDDKNGWVSMEVVPWSVSKVSRWHSSNMKPTADEKSWENKFSSYNNANPTVSKPIRNQPNKPLVNYRPGSANYQVKPFNYGNSNFNNKPNPRPAFPLPSTSYVQKVYLQQDFTDEVPRPPWNKKPNNVYEQETNDPDCEPSAPGIITDGLPPNFPKAHHEYNRRKGSAVEDDHPASHPFNGDGEWVLLTTTKGYKAPSPNANPLGKQRSLDIESQSDLDKESISTHKSVRLTVLPPLKDSKVNMTTSHGGLLQVESTFQTVDEAHKMAVKKQNMKRRPLKRRPLKRPLKQQTLTNPVPTSNTASSVTPTVNSRRKGPNASTVLAAVGAGMIPATMAMLVPMMGKRRRRDLIFSTRSPDVVALNYKLRHTF